MSFKCKVGFHTWDGCKCSICGKIRETDHDVSADCNLCSRCGKIFDTDQHDWSDDCEKCVKCGKTRENQHSWSKDCEKCSKCGKVRQDMHRFTDGICQVCGQGTFTDASDGSTYKTIKIGEQVIMAENFAKKPDEGNYWAYDDDETHRSKYGYLYDWETAKTLAPDGWHLPSKAEWESLIAFMGGSDKKAYEKLKAGGKSGFDSLFGGVRIVRGAFNSLNASAHYWTSTQENEEQVWKFKLGAYSESAEINTTEPACGLSIRFFRDK